MFLCHGQVLHLLGDLGLNVLCADNRGAQNHHRGEGTQNAVHGRHSTNAAAYTIAILPIHEPFKYGITLTDMAPKCLHLLQ